MYAGSVGNAAPGATQLLRPPQGREAKLLQKSPELRIDSLTIDT